jgi:hypothetical protein
MSSLAEAEFWPGVPFRNKDAECCVDATRSRRALSGWDQGGSGALWLST